MATEYLFIEGTAMWHKHEEPDEKYKNFTTDLYVSKEWDEKLQKAGIQLKRRINDKEEVTLPDGSKTRVHYKMKRPAEGMINGQHKIYGPPDVRIATGEVVDGVPQTEKFTGKVGNGSNITLKLEVYDTFKGKGTRWIGSRVDNLVEYDPDKKLERPLTPEYPF
jgi:hypothetical protein